MFSQFSLQLLEYSRHICHWFPAVEVECFPDAARLVRAYGTLNKKGRETEGLKWQRSSVLAVSIYFVFLGEAWLVCTENGLRGLGKRTTCVASVRDS